MSYESRTGAVLFATNLDPASLADEAFLRRIPYKIRVDDPSIEDFTRILEMNCRRRDMQFHPVMAAYLHRRHYLPGEVAGIPVAGEKFGLRLGPWKYIEGDGEGTRELFNLDDDPGERRNLYGSFPDVVEELRASLGAWRQAFDRNVRPGSLSPEDRERLRALGYVE